MKHSIFLVFAIVLNLFTHRLTAYQPYHATVGVAGASATVGDPNLVDLTRDLRQTTLELLIPFYTPTSPVAIDINLRGIDILTAFASNSTVLTVAIPQANLIETFDGGTRDASLKLFKDYIRDGGRHHKLLKAYARFSPIDPIAGNPNSLMNQMTQADYLLGRLSPFSGCECGWSAQPIVHQFQGGLEAIRGFSKKFDTTMVTLPLRYSYSPNLNWALIVDAPFTYNRNGGASSFFTSLGLGLRWPISHEWSLTPVIRGGAGGSFDLCTAGTFFSAGLTSLYNLKVGDYVVSMTNYAGYMTSTNFWLTGVNFNYDLHNLVFKNGLSLNSCKGFSLWGKQVNFGLTFEDSYFARDKLYIRHFDEVGVSMIVTQLNPCLCYDCLILGFSYQFGQKSYHGYKFHMDYQF